MAKILLIEPYYGGSHKAFANGYARHSRHEVTLLTMPARKWKWRMRGAAIWLSERLPDFAPDLLMASDYLDLAAFCSLAPDSMAALPRAVYFHENQLTYPVASHSWRDYQFGLTNITSCLAADAVFFNSHYHMDSFLQAVDELFRKMPDFVPGEAIVKIREKTEVVPVGLEISDIDALLQKGAGAARKGPMHIIWNHRWEFDKGPEEFLRAMLELDRRGVDFRLSVLGQAFRTIPPVFERIKHKLDRHLLHFGYIPDWRSYLNMLFDADVVLSTALHEFFGISVLEAVYAGCVPLLPSRLSYPELVPPLLHDECLYDSTEEMVSKLQNWAETPQLLREKNYKHIAESFAWEKVAETLDVRLERLLCPCSP